MRNQSRRLMMILALTMVLTSGGLWQTYRGLNRLLGDHGAGGQLLQVIPAVRESAAGEILAYGRAGWRLFLETVVPRSQVVIEKVRQKWSDVTELAVGGREEADP